MGSILAFGVIVREGIEVFVISIRGSSRSRLKRRLRWVRWVWCQMLVWSGNLVGGSEFESSSR